MATTEKTPEITTASTRKGNPKTEAIIGKAAHKLALAAAGITDAMKNAANLQTLVDEATIAVTHKELELAEVEVKLNNAKAQADVDLNLYIKSQAKAFVANYLNDNSEVAISREDYKKLVDERDALKTNMEAEIKAQVGKEKGMLESRLDSANKLLEAQFNAKEADNKAQIASLTAQLAASKNDAARWEAALTAERTAGIERAKASSIGSVNVGSPNNR